MILVTGASGLVGSHLIKKLLQDGKQVRALYRNNHPQIILQNIDWFKADILDVVDLDEAMQGITQVYHCAALVSFNPKEKGLLHKTNVEGTANVVNACLNNAVEKLLFVSSVASLGRANDNAIINESSKWIESSNNSAYAKSKYLAEMEVWRGVGEGLNAVIINPSIILGNSDWTKGSAAIFKSAYDAFAWYTTGVNGFVDVQDVANAMVQLMDSTIVAQRFIISAENSSYKNIFTEIAIAFKKQPPHKQVTPFLAALVWRLEAVKGLLTGNKPLLTKETAHTAQTKIYYDNGKLLKALPSFTYSGLVNSIERICKELQAKYQLK
jgi:nucleoside-diphosphate-sugar epimerase